MRHGKKELEVFNCIKRQLIASEAYGLSFDEFDKGRIHFTHSIRERIFAVTLEEVKCIENAFFKAKPNPKPSFFPDFIFDDGFIEHFEISSSETASCGSLHKKAYSSFEKEVERASDAFAREMKEQPSYDEIKSITNVFVDPNKHGHEYLIESLRNSLDKHILSLKKYEGPKNIKLFLIEYSENMLQMQTNYESIKAGNLYGDLMKFNSYEYRISRDIEALSLIYDKKEFVDYIVFYTDFYYEIIGVKDIPELIKLLPFPYEYNHFHMNIIDTTFGMSIPLDVSGDD